MTASQNTGHARLLMVQNPGSGFVRLTSVPINCVQLISLVASVSHAYVKRKRAIDGRYLVHDIPKAFNQTAVSLFRITRTAYGPGD